MAAIDFPINPTNGQVFIIGNIKYVYNSTYTTWDLVANTITGPTGPAGEANFNSFMLMGS